MTLATGGTGTEALPAAIDLGDGTFMLHDHGEIRLSANRARWWNGRAWELVAESTPWNARLDPAGEKWWDGVEWRPRAVMMAAWERRPVLAVLTATWLLWVILMAAGVLPGLLGLILIVVVSLPGVVLTLRSKILRGSEKLGYLFSVVGLALLWARSLQAGRRAGASVDGAAHMQM